MGFSAKIYNCFLAGGGNRKIIVTYPEALMEKVSTAESLSSNIISIKVNDRLDTDLVMEKLVGYGFERADFVYEPGQFAMRGGIFDIYSFGNEKPYRVELFGQDVDSIRIFDPETQLSERKLLQVNIIPNADAAYEGGEKIDLFNLLPENTIILHFLQSTENAYPMINVHHKISRLQFLECAQRYCFAFVVGLLDLVFVVALEYLMISINHNSPVPVNETLVDGCRNWHKLNFCF